MHLQLGVGSFEKIYFYPSSHHVSVKNGSLTFQIIPAIFEWMINGVKE